MRVLHESFIERLGDQMRKTFESILEDRGVVRWLNELDRLVEEARKQQVKAQGENGEAVVPYTLYFPMHSCCR